MFEGFIGAYHCGCFGFLFEVSLSNFGENKCKKLFHKFPNVNPEINIDLMKYLCAAGFMEGADDSPVTYDGSRIDHVTTRRIGSDEKNIFLKDFSVLRSKKQVTIEDGLLEI